MTTRVEQEPQGIAGLVRAEGFKWIDATWVLETPEQLREWEIAAKWRNDTAKPVDYLPPPDDRL